MQRALRNAPLLFALVAAACQQAPVLNALAPGHAVVVAGSHEGGPSLSLSVGLAEAAGAYGLLAESGSTNAAPVHRWVGADLVRYDVELRRRNASSLSQFDALSPALVGEVPVNAQGSGTATFTKLQPGAYYRAYVKAMGRKGGASGTDAVVQLNANATADFADFDFTGNNDVNAQSSQTVSVRLDDVAFSGQGGLAIGSPLPGGYASPTGALAISPILPPSPSPSPSPMGLFSVALGASGRGVSVDAQGQLWVTTTAGVNRYSSAGSFLGSTAFTNAYAIEFDAAGSGWVSNASGSVQAKLSSTGALLATYSTGAAGVLAVIPGGGYWMPRYDVGSGTQVLRVDGNGSVLGAFTVGLGPTMVLRTADGNLWVSQNGTGANSLTRLTSSGGLLGTVAVDAKPFILDQDAQGQIWVTHNGSPGLVTRLSSSGAVLSTTLVGNSPAFLDIDPQGQVWVTGSFVAKLSSSGGLLATYSVGGSSLGVVATSSGAVWVVQGTRLKRLIEGT